MADKHLEILLKELKREKKSIRSLLKQGQQDQFIFDRNKILEILKNYDPKLKKEGYKNDNSLTYCILTSSLHIKLMRENVYCYKLFK